MAKTMMNTPIAKMPPRLELDETLLPAIKGWKVGGKYKIILEVEEVRVSKGDMMEPTDKKISASFKVLSATSAGASNSPTPPPPATRNDKLAVLGNKAQTA